MTTSRYLPLLLLAASLPVLAHTGDQAHGHDALTAGLLHPVTGPDHLLMLLATGMLAALGTRGLLLPGLTLVAMLLGALAGRHVGEVAGMEATIALSLLVVGAALLLPARLRLLTALMPLLALAHGWAHGVEAGPGNFWSFVIGFAGASAMLLAIGYGIGCLLRRHQRARQLAGSGVLAAAAAILAG